MPAQNSGNGSDDKQKPIDERIERPADQTIVMNRKNSTLGLFSLIMGIVSLLTLSCCGPLSIILAITAVITGIIARTENQEYATIGIILGALGLILPVLLALFITGFAFFTPLFGRFF